ncbi:MAG TPA: hypothetical protein VNZ52_14655 [Candidatus Thermoplasmatota archaeon]|nr:hypothetical protein [Candidatus Thermoplasmatota archaeon]
MGWSSMADIFVKARIKDGKKADLAARLAGSTLGRGNPFETAIQRSLQEGYAIDNAHDAYFILPAPGDRLPEEARRVLEGYFHIDREIPREQVPAGDLARVERLTPLPEWLGIEPDGWRND